MKHISSFLLFLTLSLTVMAIPARRVSRTIVLPNGQTREVTLCGDEHFHYWQTTDGETYLQQEDGQWKPISQLVLNAERARVRPRYSLPTRAAEERKCFLGEKKGLVILVSFSDKPMTYTRQDFDNFFNQKGFNKNGSAGSVRDYFMAQSYEQFSIDFDVVGPIEVSKPSTYYGANDARGNDKYPGTMVSEAIRKASSEVNFSDYDWDGDGEVEQVFLIYAGYAESAGAPSNALWPHEWDLNSAKDYNDGAGAIHYDGVTINTYAISNELYGTSGTKMEGLGAACHEFSHCLGLPDFYDTNGSNFGMDCWDLLDRGCYLGNGYVPCGYSSYERWFCGWLDLIELTAYTEVEDMPALSDEPVVYVIRNQRVQNEYYLLENRQQQGWDAFLYGSGMLILHVEYNANAWAANTVNTQASRQRMTIIPADGKCSTESAAALTGDIWPGPTYNTELTNTSTPAAKLYNVNSDGKKFMNFPIRDISLDRMFHTISFTAGEKGGDGVLAPALSQGESNSTKPVYDLLGRPASGKVWGVGKGKKIVKK